MDWSEIKNDPTYEINRRLAKEIVSNDPKAVHFYLTEIGLPIMRHIEYSIMHRDITADYYMFLSAPFDEKEEKARWYRVDLYRGIDCLLSTYTSNITCRHFYREANKEKKNQEKENALLEYVDYESLIKCETMPDDGEEMQLQCVRIAYEMLNDRDKEVLRCLIIKNMSALKAFPVLSRFMKPRPKDGMTSEEVKSSWTSKQCQDAISLLKGRALVHLQNNFSIVKRQKQ